VHLSVHAAVLGIRASRPRLNTTAIQVQDGFITPRLIVLGIPGDADQDSSLMPITVPG